MTEQAGETTCRANLGLELFHDLSEYVKAEEYREKALAICIETGSRERESQNANSQTDR